MSKSNTPAPKADTKAPEATEVSTQTEVEDFSGRKPAAEASDVEVTKTDLGDGTVVEHYA